IVRRAGKSPPGGARTARPRRASSGPSSSTEPRSLPTNAPSGSSFTTSGQRTRSVELPMPSTSAPRSRSRRAITSTSLIRGTLVSSHHSVVSRHAASSGSAAFLLPSTETRPESRRPPSISSVDIEVPEVDDLVPELHAEAVADRAPAPLDQHADVVGGGGSVVDDEVAMRGRDPRAANAHSLESRAIDERAGRPRDPVRHVIARAVRILKNATGARRIERLCALAIRQRLPRHRAHRRRLAPDDSELGPQQHLAGILQSAAIVAECHLGCRHVAYRAVARHEPDADDLFTDQPPGEVRVAEDRPADG